MGLTQLMSARRYTPSAQQHAEVVEQYLTKEITAGRIIGPFPLDVIPGVQISRMGVTPKGHQPGKWRLIGFVLPPRCKREWRN